MDLIKNFLIDVLHRVQVKWLFSNNCYQLQATSKKGVTKLYLYDKHVYRNPQRMGNHQCQREQRKIANTM